MAALSRDSYRLRRDMDTLQQITSDTAIVIADAHAKIIAAAQSCLDSCDGDIVRCHACIRGPILALGDKAQAVIDKACKKINKAMAECLFASYDAAAHIIGPPPTTEEIIGAIQTAVGAGNSDQTQFQPPIVAPPVSPPRIAPLPIGSQPPLSPLPSLPPVAVVPPGGIGPPPPIIIPPLPPPPDPIPVPGGVEVWQINCPPIGAPTIIPLGVLPFLPQDQPPTYYASSLSEATRIASQCPIVSPPPPPPGGEICPPCKPEPQPQPTPAPGGKCNPADMDICEPRDADRLHLKRLPTCPDDTLDPDIFQCDTPAVRGGLWGDILQGGPVGAIAGLIRNGFCALRRWRKSHIHSVGELTNCTERGWTGMALLRSTLGFFQRWIGLELGPAQTRLEQEHNFTCPTDIPSNDEIDQLYARGLISVKAHENLRALRNLCPKWSDVIRQGKRTLLTAADYRRLRDAGKLTPADYRHSIRALGFSDDDDVEQLETILRVRLNPLDYVRLFLRGKIDPGTLQLRLSEAGLNDDFDIQGLLTLSEYVPSVSELIPLMVRDAFDNDIARKYDYDSEFKQKFLDSPDAQRYAAAIGVDVRLMRYVWRSHWRNPSPTMLFEAIHRLRADALDPEARRNAVTVDDVRTFLKIDDVQPWWVDKEIALSYRPMTRIDLRMAYDIGALNREQIVDGLKNLGHNDFTVGRILELWETRKRQRLRTTTSGLTARNVIKFYRERLLDADKAFELLLTAGMTLEQSRSLIDDATTHRELLERRAKVSWLKRRYKVGDLGPGNVEPLLTDAGVPLAEANVLAAQWEQELQYRGREIAAATLCKWFTRGLIDATTYAIRLRRVGYSPDDTARIIATCQGDITERERKRIEQQARRDESERRKCLTKAQKCGQQSPNGKGA